MAYSFEDHLIVISPVIADCRVMVTPQSVNPSNNESCIELIGIVLCTEHAFIQVVSLEYLEKVPRYRKPCPLTRSRAQGSFQEEGSCTSMHDSTAEQALVEDRSASH